MEEINLFSENKTHLKQLGEQLITASNKTKETEINDKIKDINDRWQHLFDHIEARWDLWVTLSMVMVQYTKSKARMRPYNESNIDNVDINLALIKVISVTLYLTDTKRKHQHSERVCGVWRVVQMGGIRVECMEWAGLSRTPFDWQFFD